MKIKQSFERFLNDDQMALTTGQQINLNGKTNLQRMKPLSKEIDNKFHISDHGRKTIYAYATDPDKVAFTEMKGQLVAQDSNPIVIKSMLEVAESKGWESVTLKGKKDFKQATWLEAKLKGFDVAGYQPTEQDQRKLERSLKQKNSMTKNNAHKDGDTAPIRRSQSERQSGTSFAGNALDHLSNRRDELKSAFINLREADAVTKFPELHSVYNIVPASKAYYQLKGNTPEQEQEFTDKVVNKSIEDIADGKKIPEFDLSIYKNKGIKSEQLHMEEVIKVDANNLANSNGSIKAANKRSSYTNGEKPEIRTKEGKPEIDFD